MRTLALSVVPQVVGCNASCKFCISRETFDPAADEGLPEVVLRRACRFARNCGAQTGIITSKGETLLTDPSLLKRVVHILSEYFGQVDLHTNGLLLPEIDIKKLKEAGLTNITLSRGHYDWVKNLEMMEVEKRLLGACLEDWLIPENRRSGGYDLHFRLSCVLAKDYIDSRSKIKKFLAYATKFQANAVIFRELWAVGDSLQAKWCREHRVSLMEAKAFFEQEAEEILSLPWGKVYDYMGMAVSVSECNFRSKDFVKSLILLPDNHLYYSWATPASMLW